MLYLAVALCVVLYTSAAASTVLQCRVPHSSPSFGLEWGFFLHLSCGIPAVRHTSLAAITVLQ